MQAVSDQSSGSLGSTRHSTFERDLIASLPALRSFARTFLKETADIEDLVQNVVMKAIRFSHQYCEGTSLKSWLYKIMRNTFYTQYRRTQRDCVSFVETPPEHTSAAVQLWHLQHQEIAAAIDNLRPDRRQVLILIARGVTYEEAAQELGVQIGTIKSRVNRARKELMVALEKPL